MKMNRLFSFDTQVIQDLNAEIARGFRSSFVNEALKEKLYGEGAQIKDATGRQLIAAALHRNDVSDFLKRCIKSELGIEV